MQLPDLKQIPTQLREVFGHGRTIKLAEQNAALNACKILRKFGLLNNLPAHFYEKKQVITKSGPIQTQFPTIETEQESTSTEAQTKQSDSLVVSINTSNEASQASKNVPSPKDSSQPFNHLSQKPYNVINLLDSPLRDDEFTDLHKNKIHKRKVTMISSPQQETRKSKRMKFMDLKKPKKKRKKEVIKQPRTIVTRSISKLKDPLLQSQSQYQTENQLQNQSQTQAETTNQHPHSSSTLNENSGQNQFRSFNKENTVNPVQINYPMQSSLPLVQNNNCLHSLHYDNIPSRNPYFTSGNYHNFPPILPLHNPFVNTPLLSNNNNNNNFNNNNFDKFYSKNCNTNVMDNEILQASLHTHKPIIVIGKNLYIFLFFKTSKKH